jgi:hypothetical protein
MAAVAAACVCPTTFGTVNPAEITKLTAVPPLTAVPAIGLSLITLPTGTVLLDALLVVTVRPAPVMAAVAAACVCPTTFGTVNPAEITKLTAVPPLTAVPAIGLSLITLPTGTVLLDALLAVTVNPAPVIADVAAACVWPTTFGTVTPVDMTKLTDVPPLTAVPATGLSLITLPTATVLLDALLVVTVRPAPVMAAVAAACVCPTTFGTVTPEEITKLTEDPALAAVPAAGFWLITLPIATVLLDALLVVPTTRPAAVMAVVAAACVCPTTFGTVTPEEITKLTGDPTATAVPAAGLWLITLPMATLALDALVVVPTTSPAPVMAVVAAACVSFTTFGTATPDEMIKLTDDPPLAAVPAAGFWLITLPMATLALDALVVVPTTRPAPVMAVVAAACVSFTTFGTVTPEEITKLTEDPAATAVPAAGLWLITLPMATLALDALVVVPTTSPAPVMAVAAAACVSFTTFGTATPDEMIKLTDDPPLAAVPAAGLSLITLPIATVLLDALLVVPTTRPAPVIAVVAAACVSFTTFGTDTPDEITKLTEDPALTCVPAAGLSLITLPIGTVLLDALVVVPTISPAVVIAVVAAACVCDTTFGTDTPDEMTKLTDDPPLAAVPAAGFWLITLPMATLALDALVVVPTTRPAPVMAVVAAACVSFTTFGTATPEEITKLTEDPALTCVPAAGLSLITLPIATVLLDALVVVPTTSPAPVIAVVAAACVCDTTFGTDTPDEMTKLTDDPPLAAVPAAGFWLITLPIATVLLDALLVVPTTRPAPVMAVVAAACVSFTTFGTATPDEMTKLTDDPPLAAVPAAGFWLITLPISTVLLDALVVVPTISPAVVIAVVAAACVCPTTFGTLTVAMPATAMLCMAEGLVLSALSVKTAVLMRDPALCGWKLRLRLHLAPGVSAELPAQSAGEPVPGTWTKFGPVTTSPGVTAFSGWLPTF